MQVAFFSAWKPKGGWPDHSNSIIKALENMGIKCHKYPLDNNPKQELIKNLDWESINRCDIAHVQYEMTFFSEKSKNCLPKFLAMIKIPKVGVITLTTINFG